MARKNDQAWFDDEDDMDPDYREDSETDDDEDDIPRTMQRDRARWVEENVEVLQELYKSYRDTGKKLFGESFAQGMSINKFSNFCYKYTMPGAF